MFIRLLLWITVGITLLSTVSADDQEIVSGKGKTMPSINFVLVTRIQTKHETTENFRCFLFQIISMSVILQFPLLPVSIYVVLNQGLPMRSDES